MEPLLLVAALILDAIIAEPPTLFHPVYWFGKVVEFFDRLRINFGPTTDLALGAVTVAAVVVFALLLAYVPLPAPIQLFWHTYLLFSAFSVKSMLQHVYMCVNNDMSAAAVQMLVSRNAAELSREQRCSAVIESIAENYVDGVVAPLFYFVLFGIAGAVVYRAINVSDAMIGYRGEYEYFGKIAAKLDDALNYIPARLSLLFFEFVRRGSFRFGIERNVKLNGCTIAAMSYVLNVKLEKPGYYSLPGRSPAVEDVIAAAELFRKLSLLAFAAAFLLSTIKILLLTLL